MCDVQGETRILHQSNGNPGVPALAPSRSTPNTPTSLRRAPSLEKCFHDSEFFKKQLERQHRRNGELKNHRDQRRSASSNRGEAQQQQITESINEQEIDTKQREKPHDTHLFDNKNEVFTNGGFRTRSCESDECDAPTHGKDIMAPVLGVPPPPPPAPHMGPDGLILPRKPYNPCLGSSSHKDLHRELLFNQKIGKSVLNQKSELQRALDRHREMASRKEAEKMQEESHKNDPRTALQRAIEQRAKHIQQSQLPQPPEPLNPLATARAKLRSRTESQ